MSKLPTIGWAAYWAAYRELVKKSWADWRKLWVGTQVGFLTAFAVHYLWLKKQVDALANLEVHVIYVVLPSLLGLLGLFVLSFLRAPWRLAQNIQTTRDQRIKELEDEVSSQRARAHELDAKLNPPDAARMAGAKRLLRDARDEAFKKASEKEKLTREEVLAFFGDANTLVFRILMKGKYTKTFNDRIMNPSKSKLAAPWELMKEMGADLSYFVEEMKFCPEDYNPEEDEEYYPYLRPGFTPVEGRSWQEYPDEEARQP